MWNSYGIDLAAEKGNPGSVDKGGTRWQRSSGDELMAGSVRLIVREQLQGAHHDGWNRGGAALGVIEHLDVIEHITAGFFASAVGFPSDALLLQQLESFPRPRCRDSYRVDSCC